MRTTLSLRRAALVFTAVGALALTGCGDGGGAKKSGGGTDKGTDSAPTVTLPKLDGENISVAAVWTGPEQANFTKVLGEFEKRTGRRSASSRPRTRSSTSSVRRSRAASRRTSR